MLTESTLSSEWIQTCYQLGQTALDEKKSDVASQYFILCAGLIAQESPQNLRLLSLVLLNLGRTLGYQHRSPNTAIACCEASANLQKQLGRSETEADRIYMAGTVVSILEDYGSARRLYQTALDRYRAIGCESKANTIQNDLREMMQRVGERRYRQLVHATTPMTQYSFEVWHLDTHAQTISITASGEIGVQGRITRELEALTSGWKLTLAR